MPSVNKKTETGKAVGKGGGSGVVLPNRNEWHKRAEKVVSLLDKWAAEDTGYDKKTWPKLKKALDKNRSSSRKLFDAE